ncbi:MAG: hypothetical protein JXA22_04840 [Candidatus Thermoplasmatota archaeon]|nr:hypothetical protein [Candidatus Thermoplasmatota archaeon]
MKVGDIRRSRKRASCEGEIRIEDGIMSVACASCGNPMDLSSSACFNGLSSRMVPGFKGMVVLEGNSHRSYQGPIVEALSSHSRILSDIRRFDHGPKGRRKELTGIAERMEKDFLRDPLSLGNSKADYLKDIRRAERSKEPPEAERFEAIVEAASIMARRLERDISSPG